MDLVSRVKDILLKPKDTWPEIKNEPNTVKDLFTSYAVILAAVPPIASFIGFSLIGMSRVGFHYRIPFGPGLGQMITSYVFSLVGVYVVGIVIDALAPSFGSSKNQLNAMKAAVYAWTPGWVAGIFLLIPFLSPLCMILSLYGLYLLYVGLPVLMETPKDKALGYVIVTVVVSIVISFLVATVSGALFGYGRGGA